MEEDNYTKHFNKELEILRKNQGPGNGIDDELIIDKFEKPIRDIIEITKQQGHSGSSANFYASYLSNAIKNILLFKPLSPITGDDAEFFEVGPDVFQNIRCGEVFKKSEDGKPYYLDAIVWDGMEEGDSFTGTVEDINSHQFIKLPFTPKTFYIDVVKVYVGKDYDGDCYDNGGKRHIYVIKDRNQLKEVAKYYDMKNE